MKYLNKNKSILISIASTYLREDLDIKKKEINFLVNELKASENLVEFAHTPSFFHIGIMRCFLHFINFSSSIKAAKIFFINDHLSVKSLKETKGIPIILPNNKNVFKYPSLKIPKKKQSFALFKTSIPSEDSIIYMTERLNELFPFASYKINKLRKYMFECSGSSSSLASWYINLLFKLTKKFCLVIPTRLIFKNLELTVDDRIIDKHLLSYCKTCGARIQNNNEIELNCNSSKQNSYIQKIPDVVLRQNIANFLGFTHRVSGSFKDYQNRCDQEKIFTSHVPIRILVNGKSKVSDSLGFTYERMNMIQYYCLSKFNLSVPEKTEVDWNLQI